MKIIFIFLLFFSFNSFAKVYNSAEMFHEMPAEAIILDSGDLVRGKTVKSEGNVTCTEVRDVRLGDPMHGLPSGPVRIYSCEIKAPLAEEMFHEMPAEAIILDSGDLVRGKTVKSEGNVTCTEVRDVRLGDPMHGLPSGPVRIYSCEIN